MSDISKENRLFGRRVQLKHSLQLLFDVTLERCVFDLELRCIHKSVHKTGPPDGS